MQADLPNTIPSVEVDRQLARHIRDVYARYGGRLMPFFEQLAKQAALKKTSSQSQLDPKIREYLERRYRLAAKLTSSEA